MGPADSVLNPVAAAMCYCCVAFGAKFDTEREGGEEVSENYKTGSFLICAAEQTISG